MTTSSTIPVTPTHHNQHETMSTQTDVSEHPIPFSGEMVRAILDGCKTQTRRVVKPQPNDGVTSFGMHAPGEAAFRYSDRGVSRYQECPYGRPGDRLWVREAFRLAERLDDLGPLDAISSDGMAEPPSPQIRYEADKEIITDADAWGRLRPSIHMPWALCRLTLVVTDVRVERLQEITHADAKAEGCTTNSEWLGEPCTIPLRVAFRRLWDDINSDRGYPWDTNPWVWVVEFSIDCK